MGLFQVWPLSEYIMKLFIIHMVCWLSLLCNLAFAQFDISEGLSGSTSFPNMALTSLGNLAIFLTCLVRGRLNAEMGARDLLDWITGPRLHKIDDFGLTTCCYKSEKGDAQFVLDLRSAQVVMLSKDKPSCSMRQFMKYTSHVYDVPSIQLQSFPLMNNVQVPAEILYCCRPRHACNCIVFQTKEDITMMLAERMPGTLKQLPDSKCLLPCRRCLENGCHACNDDDHDMWHVGDAEGSNDVEDFEAQREDEDEEEAQREHKEQEDGRKNIRNLILKKGAPKVWPVPAVCHRLDRKGDKKCAVLEEANSCICIPTHPAEHDEWTEMLITTLKTKDKDTRGVISLGSDALQNYRAQCGVCKDVEQYGTLSFIVPRLTETLVNIILTAWLRVDGFSSALVARRGVRDYIVDSKGRGIAANAFLTKSQVYSNRENTSVCQVLSFRDSFRSFGTFSIIIACVNLFCSITWAVLVALEGGTGKWYEPENVPLSKPRVYVIMVAIGLDLVSSFLYVLSKSIKGISRGDSQNINERDSASFWNNLVVNGVILNPGVTGVPHNGSERGFGWIWKNGISFIYVVRTVGFYVILAFELSCFVLGVRGHIEATGRWFYGALNALVWVRWGVGALVFTGYSSEFDRDMARRRIIRLEHLGYASTFWLNAIFIGLRGKWKYVPS